MKFKTFGHGLLWRPSLVGLPGIGAALERGGLPGGFFTFAVQVVAEKRRFDIFAKFTRRFVSAERNDADGVALRGLPFAVIPRTGDNEVGPVGVVFSGVAENLPRSPRIFLIPETGNI